MNTESDLQQATTFWQAGRDGGSSLLRGAARVVTGVPHYFTADFIDAYDAAARQNLGALQMARALLAGIAAGRSHTASAWAQTLGVPDQTFAGRGLAANPDKDEQIERRLDEGVIDMPLWGVSLDRDVTTNYGSRFLLEIVEPFPAVPAWVYSHVKAEERELITGGRYEVVSVERANKTTHARLKLVAALAYEG